jgi:hypothetical protein
LEWNPYTLVREQLGLGGTRAVEERWTLAPVVNPDKLRAIRRALQLVAHRTSSDPDYHRLLTSFLGEDYAAWIPRGWYGVGGWKDVPKGACHVVRYKGTWVWVTPDGIDGLTRLTIAILNITTLDANVPPEQPTKTVYKYTYKDGRIDTLEVMTRPDPDAPKSAGPAPRKDGPKLEEGRQQAVVVRVGQYGLGIAAAEVDGAGVAGGGVTVGVFSRHTHRELAPGRRVGWHLAQDE